MKQQPLGTFIVSAVMLATALTNTTAHAKTTESTNQFSTSPSVETTDTVPPELAQQLKTRKGGSVKFWEAVAWCETNHNWNNGGYFAGGLGMARSVWVNYGGKQFASRPQRATKHEQIIVANRVAFFGFQTKNTFMNLDDKANNKPFFRPAVGWKSMKNWGKGCVNWETRKPSRDRYTEKGIAEWKESRNPSRGVSKSGLSGSVSTQSVGVQKRCPQWEAQLKAQGLVPVKKFSYIMWRESRCQEKVVSKKNSNGTRDYGLLQINSSWRTVTRNVCGGTSMDVLLDSKCNLKVARYLFNNGGLGHWSATSGSN